jgi:uncharacterized membrane protein
VAGVWAAGLLLIFFTTAFCCWEAQIFRKAKHRPVLLLLQMQGLRRVLCRLGLLSLLLLLLLLLFKIIKVTYVRQLQVQHTA